MKTWKIAHCRLCHRTFAKPVPEGSGLDVMVTMHDCVPKTDPPNTLGVGDVQGLFVSDRDLTDTTELYRALEALRLAMPPQEQ